MRRASLHLVIMLLAAWFSRSDAQTWQTSGNKGFSPGQADYVSLAFSGTMPIIAFRDGANGNKATVMRLDSDQWVNVGIAGFSSGSTKFVSLCVDGEAPSVGFSDYSSAGKATAMRFSGVSGIERGNIPAGIRVYPNPSRNRVTIALQSDYRGSRFEVADLNGKKLLVGPVVRSIMDIDISALAAGEYFISIIDGKTRTTERIIKEY